MNNFSARLKSLMESMGLTQQRLAQLARTSQASIYRYLSGKASPQPRALEELAAALHVSPVWLLTGKGSKHAATDSAAAVILHRQAVTHPPGTAAAALAGQIPDDISRAMEDAHASPFALHSEEEIWDYITTTAASASQEKPLNKRLYLGNMLSAISELQRRLTPAGYRPS